jgi:CubicO group peptidase (beta-lactamase class C family)
MLRKYSIQEILMFGKSAFRTLVVILFGASLALAQVDTEEQRISAVENGLLLPFAAEGVTRPMTLAERMEQYSISAVSIAVVRDYKIVWAKAYGVIAPGTSSPTDTESLFRACSLTKPIVAAMSLRLAEKGVFSIDEPVQSMLTSWNIPASEFLSSDAPTIRQIISHRAGFNLHGFGTYQMESEIPSMLQVLNGAEPATNEPVELIYEPGSKSKYSGGGYEVLRMAIKDRISTDFSQLVSQEILLPLGMTNSLIAPIVPESKRGNAVAGRYNGENIQGLYGVEPELAAAGLFTTPTDYANFAIEVMKAWKGEENQLFSQATAKEFVSSEMGVFKQEKNGLLAFEHGGVTAYFESYMFFYPETGDGAVIMINGNCGGMLIKEIYRSVAAAYDWPDYIPVEKVLIPLQISHLRKLEGSYNVEGQWQFTIKAAEGILQFFFGEQITSVPIYPESELSFFDPVDGTNITFLFDSENDQAARVTVTNSRGSVSHGKRIDE